MVLKITHFPFSSASSNWTKIVVDIGGKRSALSQINRRVLFLESVVTPTEVEGSIKTDSPTPLRSARNDKSSNNERQSSRYLRLSPWFKNKDKVISVLSKPPQGDA
jgi:hypothetical protein